MASFRFPKKCTYSELERNLNIFFSRKQSNRRNFFGEFRNLVKKYVVHIMNTIYSNIQNKKNKKSNKSHILFKLTIMNQSIELRERETLIIFGDSAKIPIAQCVLEAFIKILTMISWMWVFFSEIAHFRFKKKTEKYNKAGFFRRTHHGVNAKDHVDCIR